MVDELKLKHRAPPTANDDGPASDLSAVTAALLLTADCMGTGILALPADVRTLGMAWGLAFLVANLPLNLYAGTLLSHCAFFAERRMPHGAGASASDDADGDGQRHVEENNDDGEVSTDCHGRADAVAQDSEGCENNDDCETSTECDGRADAATRDFVGLASMLFDEPILPAEDSCEEVRTNVTYNHPFTKAVLATYYVNLFLVLGNYILVMSHAVDAMVGENHLCIPTAGVIASTLMFGLSQLRTMANLGRTVSAVSLMALLIVVVQCLVALQQVGDGQGNGTNQQEEVPNDTRTVVAQMSAMASIAFAVGSQKLLLNIRHEMEDRRQAAPLSLSIALFVYGLTYAIVCFIAGDKAPSFLFDSIPAGPGRKVAGLLLWVHVSVSYAINSQALCSSLDRLLGHQLKLEGQDRFRWAIFTALVALSSYLVANAVPFFKGKYQALASFSVCQCESLTLWILCTHIADLVALCGALTSIPLTLLLPAIFHRRVQGLPLFFPTLHGNASLLLVVFSLVFTAVGLIGAIGSIDKDWSAKSKPFSCH